jgi:hypothetical protein
MTTEKRIIGDLYHFIQGGGPVSGSATSGSPTQGTGGGGTAPGNSQGTAGMGTPMPTPSLDSVTIQNTTGLALVVTVHLKVPQIQLPYITETIPAQGSTTAVFNFGTATDAFLTMDVSRADGGQSPAPFTNIDLSQPVRGYNGTLFTISLLGPYFNVTFT